MYRISRPRHEFFCHYGILRGENARKLELADLITREYEQQGPSSCQLIYTIAQQW